MFCIWCVYAAYILYICVLIWNWVQHMFNFVTGWDLTLELSIRAQIFSILVELWPRKNGREVGKGKVCEGKDSLRWLCFFNGQHWKRRTGSSFSQQVDHNIGRKDKCLRVFKSRAQSQDLSWKVERWTFGGFGWRWWIMGISITLQESGSSELDTSNLEIIIVVESRVLQISACGRRFWWFVFRWYVGLRDLWEGGEEEA